ncbi:MAG: rubrerythrin family protein [Deltaproteobacteria bacterium]|jgi:rubrerythrin|nr:rubrerythrin family protein [Deltaproteobacteria bacterium]
MTELKGSKTEINILTAFAGESQARNRYTLAASIARKEGYILISHIFQETADHEKEHAARLFQLLPGGEATITATFPAGLPSEIPAHLASAVAGEHHEWTSMYPEFAKIARQEGFEEVAGIMENIAVAEKYHESRFSALLEEFKTKTIFKKPTPVTWRCRNCGWIHEGTEPPFSCQACGHPRAYFEVLRAF